VETTEAFCRSRLANGMACEIFGAQTSAISIAIDSSTTAAIRNKWAPEQDHTLSSTRTWKKSTFPPASHPTAEVDDDGHSKRGGGRACNSQTQHIMYCSPMQNRTTATSVGACTEPSPFPPPRIDQRANSRSTFFFADGTDSIAVILIRTWAVSNGRSDRSQRALERARRFIPSHLQP
jgi:hypothetical protein